MPTTLTADNVIGTVMDAKETVKAYKGNLTTLYKTISPGNNIGTVYSWINDAVNGLWWMFDDVNGTHFFVKHDPVKLTIPSLIRAKEMGVTINPLSSKSIDQQIIDYQINNEPHWYDGIIKGVNAIGLVLVISIIIFIVATMLIKINKQYPIKKLIK